MSQLCVNRDMKHLGSLESTQEATPRATLTHLSCSPNSPRASYLDERTLTHESIINYIHINESQYGDCFTYLWSALCINMQSKRYTNEKTGSCYSSFTHKTIIRLNVPRVEISVINLKKSNFRTVGEAFLPIGCQELVLMTTFRNELRSFVKKGSIVGSQSA